jgi:hypothetical protein
MSDFWFGVKVGRDVAKEYANTDNDAIAPELLESIIVDGDSQDYYQGLASGLHTAARLFTCEHIDKETALAILSAMICRAARLYLG